MSAVAGIYVIQIECSDNQTVMAEIQQESDNLQRHHREPSIKKNFAYKSALTLSSYIMAFVTFPYVSRVLGVERIGLVNFVDNTIMYFQLFAMMGINMLGVREIAAVKEDRDKRNTVFSNLLGLNLLFTIATLLVYFIVIAVSPKLNQYSGLFYIGSAKIIGTAFLVEWFFTGIENFRYITLRALVIRLLYVIAVFMFIRKAEDYRLYFILTIGTVVVNALINSVYVRRFVTIQWRDMLSLKYLQKNCILGIYMVMTSMYITFNVMYLGLVTDNVQVGYYTTAHKVYVVMLGLFLAFTDVMLPRMSHLLANGEKKRFNELVDKSFQAMFTFSIPIVVCSIIFAPEIIYILAGQGYEGAVTPMRIIMPAALFVGIAQILAVQILTPMKRDRTLFIASVMGAVVSIVINVTVVPKIGSVGSAIVLLCSEMSVTIAYIVYVLQNRIVSIPLKQMWENVLISIPVAMICILCKCFIENPFVLLVSAVCVSVIVWIVCRRLVIHSKRFVDIDK